MGQGVVLAACGKNFGYFPNEHESPPNSDGDDSDEEADAADRPWRKAQAKAVASKGRFISSVMAKAPGADQIASRGWGPYIDRVTDEHGSSHQAIRANKAKITTPMFDKLKTMGGLHTLELTECNLKEMPPFLSIDDLVHLDVSRNKVGRIGFDKSAPNKDGTLQRFIADRNRIETIQPAVFSDTRASALVVISLANNNLAFLPRDFASGAEKLRYLDVSYNRLMTLPDSITQCKSLQTLFVQHNELTSLLHDIGAFRELRKLFADYNKLTDLPESIGDCQKLEKVRVASNQIRYLPDSFIKLWDHEKNKTGRGNLKELKCDRNPLVQPSITAFEMGGESGGLDRAMTLFADWLEEKEKQRRQAEEQERLMLEQSAAEAAAGAELRAITDGGDQPRAKFSSQRTHSLNRIDEISDAGEWRSAGQPTEATEQALPSKNSRYYFPDSMAPAIIAQIRMAESEMLLRKKLMYISSMVRAAKDKKKKAESVGAELPEKDKRFLDENFKAANYDETIPTQEVDLSFNLLVYSMKPMFNSCQTMFDKYQDSTEEVMTYKEWMTMCSRAPVRLPDNAQSEMWQLMAPDAEFITETEFIAAFHIHDVEEQDPFIRRLAQVQRLDYYDMDPAEMRARCKAMSATEATLPLTFDAREGGPNSDWHVELDPVEGERLVPLPRREGAGGPRAKAKVSRPSGEPQGSAGKQPKRVSMTNAQYIENEGRGEGGGNDDRRDDAAWEMNSDALSRDDNSELDPFDAAEILRKELEAAEALKKKEQQSRQALNGRPSLRGAASSSALKGEGSPRSDDGAAKSKPQGRKKKSSGGPAGKAKDPNYRTDVFGARRALREAFRNMPLEDFKKLVNFLVRGMKRIEELDDDESATYWHVDDPSFRAATGVRQMHLYAKHLLVAMGFVLVGEVYWVWPRAHLQDATTGIDWGQNAVDPECPGLSRWRLKDMIALFQKCKQSMDQPAFNGHFT
mmetsp:Transcript_8102/g.23210  ORF Transcript_8102/g.23210 Transcript_8102/m.23210 type:complete len:970 (+) Transcript_8102:2-2911(+)